MFYLALFLAGGGLYVVLELFWRGRSHVSMFVAGGAALVLLYGVFAQFAPIQTVFKCILGAVIITAIEFVTGAVVNVRLGLCVWDYSRLPYNLYGQICLRYSVLWALLSAPVTLLPPFVQLIRG